MTVNQYTKARKGASAPGPRPKRGPPELTRERIIEAAATLFNRLGYHGTDSNSIAKEAGYATGTFYKHFRDKREAFLSVYERWVAAEWQAIEAEIAKEQSSEETARRIVDLTIDFHTEWRGLRASLMELIFADEEARRFFRAQRLRQLAMMARLRRRLKLPVRTREQDAIHLFMTERVFDAIGQGEIQALGLDCTEVREAMVQRVLALLR